VRQESLIEDHVGRRSYQRREVFVVGGQPTVTYNPRPGRGVDQRVRDYLDERHRILFITGPTKSGKTVLVRSVVPDALKISGGDLLSADAFWADIVDGLSVDTEESVEEKQTEATSTSKKGSAGIRPAGIGIGGEKANASESGTQRSVSSGRVRDPRRAAKAALRESQMPVIVDDFHHVEPDVQRQIVRGVKDLVFDGVPVILVAVPHRAADIVRAEREMRNRVESLQITPWSQQELEDIAARGFDALNIECPSALSEKLASESYSSPHLMQNFCLQICKANDIRETRPERTHLSIPKSLNPFFRQIAGREGEDEAYRRLAQGPRHRTDRKRRTLKNGDVTDLYGVVLAAIAETGPKTEIDWTEIRTALRKVMTDDPPRKGEYTNALEHMSKIARDLVWEEEHGRFVGDPVLEFDPTLDKLHISDPFFAFQLRWAIRQSNGS
jgi:hypothetical protein